jgi:hypothetical protein
MTICQPEYPDVVAQVPAPVCRVRPPASTLPHRCACFRRKRCGLPPPGAPHAPRISTARAHGAALPVVLLISSMMLVTSAAWFEASLVAARTEANVRDTLQAFRAADSPLTLCTRAVLSGTAPIVSVIPAPPAMPGVSAEPSGWKLEPTFSAGAFTPLAQWPGSIGTPQCLVEAWQLSTRPDATAFLLTARGFGRTRESQAWLQLELVVDGERVERHWRRVAARPF